MFNQSLIKRSLCPALAIGAAAFPAAAQARFDQNPLPVPTSPPAQAAGTLSAQRQLDQLRSNVQRRFAAEGGWPSAASSAPRAASSPGGFQWGDAGIGAAGAILLLGAGAGAASVMRPRRSQRKIAG